jgi:AraC-like DNA-binding protein/mannose-6-phosphate isomerase-like protein (cupin superfamily)
MTTPLPLTNWNLNLNQFIAAIDRKVKIHIPKSSETHQTLPLPQSHVHGHPELFLQLDGATEFIFAQETMVVESGEILIMPSGIPHGEKPLGENGEFRQFVIMLVANTCQLHHGDRLVNGGVPEITDAVHWSTHRSDGYDFLLHQCIPCLREQLDMSLGRQLLKSLLGIIQMEYHDVHPTSSTPALVRKAIQIIHEEAGRGDFNIKMLAQKLECHPDYLSQCFKGSTGDGPKSYLLDFRMTLAKSLLVHSTFRISRVAELSGFNQSEYFSSVFKKREDMTPATYRKKYTGSLEASIPKLTSDNIRETSIW